ncbi:hypothetical protein [Bacillus sp. FJAT-44742]|uniref:hypothetical protein n=1 Tax=Bacillus sp. FJAT-44742 TaxID=2014005 RepID=UPI000C2354CD|nr:hypothetical protein [Bacillus sp. FJAT-44742]
MIKKKTVRMVLAIAGVHLVFLLIWLKAEPSGLRETFSIYPPDPKASYEAAETSLDILHIEDDDEYILEWSISSSLNEEASLRQDLSLFFENGYLRDVMTVWEEDSKDLSFKKKLKGEDSNKFEVLTLHHAEILKDQEGWKSRQSMSHDTLYVLDSPFTDLHSFKNNPSSSEDQDSKEVLDYIMEQQLNHVEKGLRKHFSLEEDIDLYPITAITSWYEAPPAFLPEDRVDAFIGTIWETLYHHVLLDKKSASGTKDVPLGHSMPFIAWSQEEQCIYLIVKMQDGSPVKWKRPFKI